MCETKIPFYTPKRRQVSTVFPYRCLPWDHTQAKQRRTETLAREQASEQDFRFDFHALQGSFARGSFISYPSSSGERETELDCAFLFVLCLWSSSYMKRQEKKRKLSFIILLWRRADTRNVSFTNWLQQVVYLYQLQVDEKLSSSLVYGRSPTVSNN